MSAPQHPQQRTPPIPFMSWAREDCEFLMEILGPGILKNEAMCRLLIDKEFASIKASDAATREGYFAEAKFWCQEQLANFVGEGSRCLIGMTLKKRAKRVMLYKYRYEEFLKEIAICLDIYVGAEQYFAEMIVHTNMSDYTVSQSNIRNVLDRTSYVFMPEAMCLSKRRMARMVDWKQQPKPIYYRNLQEVLKLFRGLSEEEAMGRGARAKLARGRNAMKYLAGRGIPPHEFD